ncbi:MAG: protein TolR [Pseudomonadales bacterium]|jgi:biopolymer transport protein TolR|nr:protein TolR [Pseudomonadales bacterium]MDA0958027.1 protein TolR [Pseudomonadota bacterium]
MAKARRRRPMSDINVVPYIDVMLVLLVIFMVTAPLMTQGIKVTLPEATSDPIAIEDASKFLTVTIDKTGGYSLDVEGDQASLELSQVAESVAKIAASNPDIQVLVEGDVEIPYGLIVDLMDRLQQAGVQNVGLITQPTQI